MGTQWVQVCPSACEACRASSVMIIRLCCWATGFPPATRARGNDLVPANDPAREGTSGEISPQLTAFFTSALILASAVAVNSFSAKEVGHRAPSSRFASSLKPNVAYLELNFDAGVK